MFVHSLQLLQLFSTPRVPSPQQARTAAARRALGADGPGIPAAQPRSRARKGAERTEGAPPRTGDGRAGGCAPARGELKEAPEESKWRANTL